MEKNKRKKRKENFFFLFPVFVPFSPVPDFCFALWLLNQCRCPLFFQQFFFFFLSAFFRHALSIKEKDGKRKEEVTDGKRNREIVRACLFFCFFRVRFSQMPAFFNLVGFSWDFKVRFQSTRFQIQKSDKKNFFLIF